MNKKQQQVAPAEQPEKSDEYLDLTEPEEFDMGLRIPTVQDVCGNMDFGF